MIRLLRRAALGVLIFYAVVLGGLVLAERSLLYPAGGRAASATEAGLSGFEDLVLGTADGERLAAWWKPPEPGRAVLVYFHGNGGSLFNRRMRARTLTASGRGLLMVSYRGYAGSTGSPSEEGLRQDAQAAYDWLARSYAPARIVLYGESLGTGVAVRLATERQVAGLVLDAPFTSTEAVAAGIYPFVPVRWLMRDQFRSIDIIDQVKAPILILHGTADRVIPFAFGEALFKAAPEPKRFVRLEGVGHVSILEQGGLPEVERLLQSVEAAYAASDASPAPRP